MFTERYKTSFNQPGGHFESIGQRVLLILNRTCVFMKSRQKLHTGRKQTKEDHHVSIKQLYSAGFTHNHKFTC